MHYLLAMEHVERLARDIRRNEQHLLEANIHHKSTVKVIFRIIEKAISIITYPVNINCESVMVHVTSNTVLCTDPHVERSVIVDPLVIDWIRLSIDEVHKTLLLISSISRSH